ncbi:glycosyltransferase family 2 protein [Polaribacter sp. L3A8]|uniref:glycosyltransferase family 2 protein n=1 Tax=Polaribacter sp. L3A8 TaxID=2686361 RepID=UPI00131EBEAA|nr:glycosyltransferase family 2 protein [Polaribacter sp. L3A8]
MKTPLVSIIIPTYNSIAFLQQTVESTLNQSYTNIEVIVIDDGSTDNTQTLFDDFKRKGVQCYKVKNKGASNARNIGLSKAKGNYIQFLDSDDILHKDKIELQLKKMLQVNADLSFTYWANFSKDISKHDDFRFIDINYSKICTGKDVMVSYGIDNWFVIPVAWLVHKSLIEKAGAWNVNITNNDDGEYFSRILYHSKKVICIDKILGYYRVLPTDSLSSLNSLNKFESAFKSYGLITELLKKDKNTDLLSYSKRMYYHLYIWAEKEYPSLSKKAAKEFDKLKANSFLSKKKKYWICIEWFGLFYGTIIYKNSVKILVKIRKVCRF